MFERARETEMQTQTSYPIAEIFESIQGEGRWAGHWTTFVRLAGCNVGVKKTDVSATCTSVCGQEFTCDTDFYTIEARMTVEEIRKKCSTENVCLTGGEPFIHNLEPLVSCLSEAEHFVSIETSGTRGFPLGVLGHSVWISCSPKAGFLAENAEWVNEWKCLVQHPEDEVNIEVFMKEHFGDAMPAEVYLQPVNHQLMIDPGTHRIVCDMLRRHPSWRLSTQLHKILGMR